MNASASASSVIDGLVAQLGICRRATHRNLDGISHEESLLRPVPGGNSANWVPGHIVSARSNLLKRLGESPLLDDETTTQYRRGSDGNIPTPLPVSELLATLDRSQPLFTAAMRRFSDEQLASKAPFSSPAGDDATLAEALAAMVCHESYHVGQLGLLRRVCGKKGAI